MLPKFLAVKNLKATCCLVNTNELTLHYTIPHKTQSQWDSILLFADAFNNSYMCTIYIYFFFYQKVKALDFEKCKISGQI
jgi:hypothetical protein